MALAQESIKRGARKVYAGVRSATESNAPGIEQIKIDVTDPASIAAAAARCGDTTLLVNNAGIGRIHTSMMDPAMIDIAREVFETNMRVLCSPRISASKSAEWSFTNALRIELRKQNRLVLGLHVGFMDTDLTKGYEMKKIDPRHVAEAALTGVESNKEEVLVDEFTREVKRSLCSENPIDLNPPEIG